MSGARLPHRLYSSTGGSLFVKVCFFPVGPEVYHYPFGTNKKRMQAFPRIRFLFSSRFRDIFRTLAAYIIPASSAIERQHSHHTGNKTQ